MFELEFTESALEDLRSLRKTEQSLVLDEIEQRLPAEPLTASKNRKQLRPNDLAAWQLRVGRHRIFYDVDLERSVVVIKAIGEKVRERLLFRGKEFKL